jgi:hypothetical protein
MAGAKKKPEVRWICVFSSQDIKMCKKPGDKLAEIRILTCIRRKLPKSVEGTGAPDRGKGFCSQPPDIRLLAFIPQSLDQDFDRTAALELTQRSNRSPPDGRIVVGHEICERADGTWIAAFAKSRNCP